MLPNRPPLRQISAAPFDLIVIGGGINGAGIARDAALRGFRVALFERSDFASGTSSRSSKLIHGGIRYLEQGLFSLVFESSLERHRLLAIAPHLVHPLPFLFPIYGESRWVKTKIHVGMILYDLLSLSRNIRPHRMLSRRETLRLEPSLSPDGLIGSALYYDAQMNDARLCLANILEARSLGAAVRNYAEAIGLIQDARGRITGVRVRDRISGEEAVCSAPVVVNAAGPWVDEVCRMESPKAYPKVRMTRGSHLILPPLTRRHAVVIRNRKDGRILFAIPWEGRSLIGTTDVDFQGDPAEVRCPAEDRDYILAQARRYFSEAPLGADRVIASFAGLRPLVDSGDAAPSSVSRESRIEHGPSGLISITGGKFTTYRKIAEAAVDRVCRLLPEVKAGRCVTASKPLWGGEMKNREAYIEGRSAESGRDFGLASVQMEHLIGLYGTHHTRVLDLVRDQPALGERLHPSLPDIGAEVVHAVREESAVTLTDLLRRRTTIALGPCRADETVLSNALRLMSAELGWTDDEIKRQRDDYLRETG